MSFWRSMRPSPRRAVSRLRVAGAAALVLALTSCASSGDQQEAAEGAIPIKVMSTSATFTDLPTIVIVAQGYFEKVGLDAEFDFGSASNASLITQSVISRQTDIGISGAGALYNAYAEGMTDLVSLGTANPSITFGVALNQQTIDELAAKGVTPQSPAADRVQAMKGMQITASPQGSTGNSYLRTVLQEYGVNPDTDLTIVPNNDASAQIASTRTGRTNGFAQSFPRVNFPEAQGWGAVWLNLAQDVPSITPLASHDYYTTRTWLRENPEAAKRMMQAMWLAQQDLQNPTQELKDKIKALPEFRELEPAAFDSGWELSIEAYKGATPITTQQMFDNEARLVNLSRTAPLTFGFADIYDLAPAEAAKPAQGG
jgi:NitT/TauT family transport system substrate-binding protein